MTVPRADQPTLTPIGTIHTGQAATPIAMPSSASQFAIVGVGSSAGGLSALISFLGQLPINTGMAFVLIQHLDPHHESQLPTLLSRTTRIPVVPAADGLVVAPDHIYLITPNTSLTLERGTLRASPRDASARPHLVIDHFMRSLAQDRPGRAIGVVLSGTGTDGTLGLAAIKAAGGITFAQDDSAEHDAMPMSAIHHGCVDLILPPNEIAEEIEKIAVHGFPSVPASLPVAADLGEDDRDAGPMPPDDDRRLGDIIDIIRSRAGIDFVQYRTTTIRRRVIRRISVLQLPSLDAYATFIADHPEETAALVKDLLINVTSFYRDRAAFDALAATVFPALLLDRRPQDAIRIWVAGCSTGQEVYTIAIELLEYLKAARSNHPVQIFASDISEWALARARSGYYPESAVSDIPADRLAGYFTKDHLGYRVGKVVRDLCVFAKHDVTADTPFSKMDLISCRNVLIYLAPVLQMKVLHTFHFALKPSGFMLLGSVETVGRSVDLFGTVDEAHRIYNKKFTARRISPLIATPKRESAPIMPPSSQPFVPTVTDLQRAADRLVLGRFAPAGVLVNEALDIIQFRGHTHPFLEPAQGEVSLHLLTMVPYGVANALKEAINEAKERMAPVRRERVGLRRGQHFSEISFEIIPILMSSANPGCYLILFEEASDQSATAIPPAPASGGEGAAVAVAAADAREIAQLRNELIAANDHIQAIAEECRSVTEQLRTAHEESTSTSEEFRSTNEELQTAKEEVDAANEELITVNEELRNSNQALAKTTELTTAIVETMRYPLLVLDEHLSVESANKAFLDTFQVTSEQTIGRRIYQLGNGMWDIPELRRLIEDILPHNSAFDDFQVSHDFAGIGPRIILVNARRLQTEHPRPRIVLVFADITESQRLANHLKKTSEELMRSNSELDQFAAVASHDLHEPLRMVTNYLQLLERKYASSLDDQARDYMHFAISGAQRMSAMIKSILDYAKLGHEGPAFTPIDSGKALADALLNLKEKIGDAGADITSGPMPTVRSNLSQLTQLFQNLIGNAVKFRSADRQARVHVSASRAGAEWIFTVADNGIGVEAEHFERIFQVCQRLPSAQDVPGAGIGLATCKKIVEHHGGRIWLESKPGEGSTFFFSIPA